jgi:hypothetical protein
MEINRRGVLLALGAAGLGSLALSCRTRAGDLDDTMIRTWFRASRQLEISNDDLAAIRAYLAASPLGADPMLQPSCLFDPAVELG